MHYFSFPTQSNVLAFACGNACKLLGQTLCTILLVFVSHASVAGSLINYGISHLIGSNQTTARQFNQRFGFNANYNHEDLISSPQLMVEADHGVSLLSDWHLGKGDFRLSAGLLYHPDNVANMTYGFSLSQLNPTSGFAKVNNDGLASYLGLGWGNNIRQDAKIDYNLDLGILYQPDNRILGQSAYAAQSGNAIDDQLESSAISPVLSFGVSYSF